MSMIATGIAWLNEQLTASVEEAITYSDGTHTLSIGAIPGPTEKPDFQTLTPAQSSLTGSQVNPENQDRPFSILLANLVVSGTPFNPANGHKITWSGRIYEVCTPYGLAHRWEKTDNETRIKVHTKFLRNA